MSYEVFSNRLSFEQIVAYLQSKKWYVYANGTDAFRFDESTRKVADDLRISVEAVRRAFRTSFTPDSATRVFFQTHEKKYLVSLAQIASTLGAELFLWTVGDPPWQRCKLEKSGLVQFFRPDHQIIVTSAKRESLKSILEKMKERVDGEYAVIVVDDKPSNLEIAMQVGESLGYGSHLPFGEGETRTQTHLLGNYHLELNNDQRNAQRFAEHLLQAQDALNREAKTRSEQAGRTIPPRKLVVVFDLDGVLVDNDRTIQTRVAQKLWELMQNKS